MANTTVAFNLPSPYQTDLDKIAQQQKMAELLQAQSLQPTERYSYKGIEARTPVTAGLAKMLQGFTAMQMQEKGLEEQKALGERYRGDQSADFTNIAKILSAPAVAGQAEVPARQAEIAPEERAQSADYGTPLPGAAIPAVPARRAGQIDPEMIGQAKTPEGQQMLMAQLLSQIGPKAPIKLGPGESLVNPTTFKSEFTAPEKQEYGTTPHYEMVDGKPMSVVYDKQGNRKVIGAATPMNQFTTPTVDAAATLNQTREISDRAFYNLSANQRAQLENEGARLGISAQQLYYDTGLKGGGGAVLPPPGAAPQQAMPTQGAAAPRPMVQTAAPQPGAMVPQRPAALPPGVTPAGAAALAKDKAMKDQDAARQLPQVIATANLAINNIDDMIGDLGKKLPAGVEAKAPHPGFEDAVGATYKPFFRHIPGTNASDFSTRLEQVKGGAFLQAFEALKGGGQITEIEGAKATAAINRMSAAQSEKEFVTAAREYQDVMRGAVERAQGKAGVTPNYEGPDRRTSAGKIRAYNPQTGRIE